MPRPRVLRSWDQTLDHLSAIDRHDTGADSHRAVRLARKAPSAPPPPGTAGFALADTA